MTTKVVTRFAPSPTGYLHIGGARTALYSYLFAKKRGGKFILRIEDTDLERSTDESIQAILDGMTWLGLSCDEGPLFQTKRFDLYKEATDKLLASGKAYPCFCDAQSLQEKREAAQAQKIKYRYDRTCYQLSKEEQTEQLKAGKPHVIRFYSEDDQSIVIDDAIKGKVVVNSNELDDLIIRRSDGSPTYNLTVVVDDATMSITHVIRGDDHLNNTPRQIQLYKALGYALPTFAHLPMILGADKKRLSKRHGATSVMAYKDMGYLPQALLNYLVKLGWGHKDQEVFSLEEMIQLFDLEGCNSSPGVFNPQKLDWLNGHYIKEAQPQDLVSSIQEIFQKQGIVADDQTKLARTIQTAQAKAKTLVELAEAIKLFFANVEADTDAIQKNINDTTKPIIKRVAEELEKLPKISHDTIHSVFETVMTEFDTKLGKVANPVRVALSGLKVSPGAYDLIEILGKEESLKRLKNHV